MKKKGLFLLPLMMLALVSCGKKSNSGSQTPPPAITGDGSSNSSNQSDSSNSSNQSGSSNQSDSSNSSNQSGSSNQSDSSNPSDSLPPNTDVTITFYDGESVVSTKTGKAGDRIDVEDPSKAGMDFDGWYTDASFNTKFTSDTLPSISISLYAKFVQHFEVYDHNNGVGYLREDSKPVLYYEIEVVHDGGKFYIDMWNTNEDYETPDYVKNVTIYSNKDMKNALYTKSDFITRDYYGTAVYYLDKEEGIPKGKYYIVAEVNDLDVAADDEIRFDLYYEDEHSFDPYGNCRLPNCDEVQTEGIVYVDGLAYSDTLTLAPGESITFIFDGSSLPSDTMLVSIRGTKDNDNNVTVDGYNCDSIYTLRGNFDFLPMVDMGIQKGKCSIIFGTDSWSITTPTTITFTITITVAN